jgi:branched-chain amino acid transport system permease protein
VFSGALSGLALGGLYATVAVCLTLMAQLVRVVNFAQVALGMFGAYAAAALAQRGLPTLLAVLTGLCIGTLASGILGAVIARWMPEADITHRSVVSIGALLLTLSGSYIAFGTDPRTFTPILDGSALQIGDTVITKVGLAMCVLAVVIALFATTLLRKTDVGVLLRALSERQSTAELLGVPARRLTIGVWMATGLVASIAVALVAPTQTNDQYSLSMLVVPAAAGALLGAFKSVWLSVVGGIGLGMLQGALAQFNELSVLKFWIPFAVILVLLLWSQRKEVWDVAR